jgi:hypothetical protein
MPADMLRATLFSAIAFAIGLTACGGQSLTTPENLRIDTYPKDTPFTLTLVMESCRDTCATYGDAECSVEVAEENMILVEIEVSYERLGDQCAEVCAGEVLAHCDVNGLPAGKYTVKAGGFQRTIDVI